MNDPFKPLEYVLKLVEEVFRDGGGRGYYYGYETGEHDTACNNAIPSLMDESDIEYAVKKYIKRFGIS